jgi:SAM-dependent methyltransferase
MLELVVAAHRAASCAVEPTVLDQCPTPLLLCAWYGARAGVPVRTVASDLLAWREPEAFDVVCTHSLLRSFPRAVQGVVLERWRELLRPGGALVTVTRLDPAGDAPASASPAQAEAFAARVAAAARRRGDAEPEAAALAARAQRFAAAAPGHPIGGVDALVALVEQAGLAVERLAVRRIAGPAGAASAPGAAREADYAELVAVRP